LVVSVAGINRRSVFGKGVVGITIQPAFARLCGSNDRMSRGVRMFAGVTIWRAVAAERHPASLARPQMNPVAADLDALFAFTALRLLD
jgi:hypothetical protein